MFVAGSQNRCQKRFTSSLGTMSSCTFRRTKNYSKFSHSNWSRTFVMRFLYLSWFLGACAAYLLFWACISLELTSSQQELLMISAATILIGVTFLTSYLSTFDTFKDATAAEEGSRDQSTLHELMRTCPYCGQREIAFAYVCRHCRRQISPVNDDT